METAGIGRGHGADFAVGDDTADKHETAVGAAVKQAVIPANTQSRADRGGHLR